MYVHKGSRRGTITQGLSLYVWVVGLDKDSCKRSLSLARGTSLPTKIPTLLLYVLLRPRRNHGLSFLPEFLYCFLIPFPFVLGYLSRGSAVLTLLNSLLYLLYHNLILLFMFYL